MNNAIYVLNGVLVSFMLLLVYFGRIDWSECMAGIGLLMAPSATHAAFMGGRNGQP